MRIRQIVFAAESLQPTLDSLSAVLDGPVVFRDPGVAHFGLENGLLVSGGDFIEVVSPLPDAGETAAGRHLSRRGDSFYMLIFNVMMQARIERLVDRGLRAVWRHDADGLVATHFTRAISVRLLFPSTLCHRNQAMTLGIAPMRIGFGRAGRRPINPKRKIRRAGRWPRLNYVRPMRLRWHSNGQRIYSARAAAIESCLTVLILISSRKLAAPLILVPSLCVLDKIAPPPLWRVLNKPDWM